MVHALKIALSSIIAQHGLKNRPWLELSPDHNSLLKGYSSASSGLVHLSNPHPASIDAEDGQFGSVFSFGVLERHPNHIEFMQEVWRVLQPYGRFLGAVPVHSRIRHLRIFTPDKLTSELRFVGFKSIHVYKIRHELILPMTIMPSSFRLLPMTSTLTVLPPHWLVFTATRTPSP